MEARNAKKLESQVVQQSKMKEMYELEISLVKQIVNKQEGRI